MSNTTFSEEYLTALKRLDIANLFVILIVGIITFPVAFFVYFKLFTSKPFNDNFTFRLIAIAGIVDFLVYLGDLIFIQLSTFTMFNGFFDFLNETGLSPIAFGCIQSLSLLQILLSLSVAVNRLLFITKRRSLEMHGRLLFFCSIGASIGITAVCLPFTYTPSFTYMTTYMGSGVYSHSPSGGELPSYLTAALLALSVSSVLFLVSISLAKSVFTYRRQISQDKGMSIESGLVIVAISNFVIYLLFVAAMMIGYYFEIVFLSYSVCLLITIIGKMISNYFYVSLNLRKINASINFHTESQYCQCALRFIQLTELFLRHQWQCDMEIRCFCGCISVPTGTIIISLLIIILSIIPIVIDFIPSVDVDPSHKIVDSIEYSFAIFACLLTILGCGCKRAGLIIPALVILGLLIFFVAVRLVLCIVGLFVTDSIIPNFIREVRKTNDDIFLYTAIYSIVNTIHILVLLFIFPVFRDCYDYLRELEGSRIEKVVIS